jgi:hypothetical protein
MPIDFKDAVMSIIREQKIHTNSTILSKLSSINRKNITPDQVSEALNEFSGYLESADDRTKLLKNEDRIFKDVARNRIK